VTALSGGLLGICGKARVFSLSSLPDEWYDAPLFWSERFPAGSSGCGSIKPGLRRFLKERV
jgi:hypothetical protein